MDNWVYWETLAQQRQAERKRSGEKLRVRLLAKAGQAAPPVRSRLASCLVKLGVKLDAEAARTAASGTDPTGARRAA
jgi:hypothetical protein